MFVLTHHARPSIALVDNMFRFPDASPQDALAQTFDDAEGKDVRIGGGVAAVREFLESTGLNAAAVVQGAEVDTHVWIERSFVKMDRKAAAVTGVARGMRAATAKGLAGPAPDWSAVTARTHRRVGTQLRQHISGKASYLPNG